MTKKKTFKSRTGEAVIKPWGREDIIEHNERYTIKLLTIDPGQRMSLQYHESKTETIFVKEGTLINYLDSTDNVYQLYMCGSWCHVETGQVHRFAADSEKVVLIECSTSELDDVVRLADDYSRSE